jgi:hypothetical protein
VEGVFVLEEVFRVDDFFVVEGVLAFAGEQIGAFLEGVEVFWETVFVEEGGVFDLVFFAVRFGEVDSGDVDLVVGKVRVDGVDVVVAVVVLCVHVLDVAGFQEVVFVVVNRFLFFVHEFQVVAVRVEFQRVVRVGYEICLRLFALVAQSEFVLVQGVVRKSRFVFFLLVFVVVADEIGDVVVDDFDVDFLWVVGVFVFDGLYDVFDIFVGFDEKFVFVDFFFVELVDESVGFAEVDFIIDDDFFDIVPDIRYLAEELEDGRDIEEFAVVLVLEPGQDGESVVGVEGVADG